MNDYIPFMDRFPELHLRPVTEFLGHSKIQKYDYVQDLRLTGVKAPNGLFYIIVKDGKFGLYMYSPSLIYDTCTIALKPIYDSIEFIYYQEKNFGAVVQLNGKYGMIFWGYGILMNGKETIKCIYDSIVRVENGRYKAIKNNQVTYFNSAGQILK